jgi:alpha-galactosidase
LTHRVYHGFKLAVILAGLVAFVSGHGQPAGPGASSPRDYVLAAPVPRAPRLNGARIFGVRPGSPVLFKVAASGEGPLVYRADGLPTGLALDSATGILTGRLDRPGEYPVQLHVANAHGTTSRELRLVVGDRLALTPPMGWNSWYCWSESVSQEKVAASARMMAKKLSAHGWTYVNIDDCWQGVRGGAFGAIQPNERFPDIARLADEIHALGLKFGIYSTPWMGSYAGFIGGSAEKPEGGYTTALVMPEAERPQPTQLFGRHPGSALRGAQVIGPYQFTDRDARQYAAWGVDFIKYDWRNSVLHHTPLQPPVKRTDYPKIPESIARLARELKATDRDIVLSLSPITDWENRADVVEHTQLWRITRDIKASWASLDHVFDLEDWFACTGPGHWADPDMLQVGSMGVVNAENRTLRPTALTPDEQLTQMSLWCLLSAPLLLSCDLTALDDFTLALLTNDEVIDLDQDALGLAARRISRDGKTEVWVKRLEDHSLAIGFFNRGESAATARVSWADLGIRGTWIVRDLWRRTDVAAEQDAFVTELPPHGVRLVRLRPRP